MRLWTIMSPFWLVDDSTAGSLILPGWTNRSLEGLSDADVHEKLHNWFWSDAVDYGGFRQLVEGNFVGPAALVTIAGKHWMGRFANPDFDREDSGSEDVGDGPYDPTINVFEQLSQEALYHFADPASPPPKVAEVFDEDITGRNHWLEFLYRLFPGKPEQWNYNSHFPFPLNPEESFLVTGLPCNVFLASARAIEMVIDRKPQEVFVPPCITVNDSSKTSDATDDAGDERRPAYERDHLWLKWSQEGMTPAEIRDRWNQMGDEERSAVSTKKWRQIESEGGSEGERDLIEKALKKAKREQLWTGDN
jgi:hypothetical protein